MRLWLTNEEIVGSPPEPGVAAMKEGGAESEGGAGLQKRMLKPVLYNITITGSVQYRCTLFRSSSVQ